MSVAVVVPVPKSTPAFLRREIRFRESLSVPIWQLTAIRAGMAELSDSIIVATDSRSSERMYNRFCVVARTATHDTAFAYALDAVQQRKPDARTVVIVSPSQPRFRRWHLQAMLTDHFVAGREASVMVCPQKPSGKPDTKTLKVAIGHHARALWFSRGLLYLSPTRGVEHFYWHCGIDIFSIDALRRVVSHPQSPIELAERIDHLRLIDADISTHCFIAPRTYPLIDTAKQLSAIGPELGWHDQYL